MAQFCLPNKTMSKLNIWNLRSGHRETPRREQPAYWLQQGQNRILNAFGNGHKQDQMGKKVVRYEWRNFKRIWQTKPSRAWVQAKMNNITFFNHLYRLHPPLPNLQSVIGAYRRTRSGSSSADHHRSLPTTNY